MYKKRIFYSIAPRACISFIVLFRLYPTIHHVKLLFLSSHYHSYVYSHLTIILIVRYSLVVFLLFRGASEGHAKIKKLKKMISRFFFVYPSTYLFIYSSIYLFVFIIIFLCLFVYLPINLFITRCGFQHTRLLDLIYMCNSYFVASLQLYIVLFVVNARYLVRAFVLCIILAL